MVQVAVAGGQEASSDAGPHKITGPQKLTCLQAASSQPPASSTLCFYHYHFKKLARNCQAQAGKLIVAPAVFLATPSAAGAPLIHLKHTHSHISNLVDTGATICLIPFSSPLHPSGPKLVTIVTLLHYEDGLGFFRACLLTQNSPFVFCLHIVANIPDSCAYCRITIHCFEYQLDPRLYFNQRQRPFSLLKNLFDSDVLTSWHGSTYATAPALALSFEAT